MRQSSFLISNRIRRIVHRSVPLVAATLLIATAVAQNDRGSIVGKLTDASGAILPGATISVENTGTHIVRTQRANSSGDSNFTALIPGTYMLTVSAPGFKRTERSNLLRRLRAQPAGRPQPADPDRTNRCPAQR